MPPDKRSSDTRPLGKKATKQRPPISKLSLNAREILRSLNCMEIGGILQNYMLNTVINFLFKNFIALQRHLVKTPLLSFIHTVQIDLSITQQLCFRQVAPQCDEIFKQTKINDCVQHITLQKFTNFYAIRSWRFQNICNEIGLPRFLRHPVHVFCVLDIYVIIVVIFYFFLEPALMGLYPSGFQPPMANKYCCCSKL